MEPPTVKNLTREQLDQMYDELLKQKNLLRVWWDENKKDALQ